MTTTSVPHGWRREPLISLVQKIIDYRGKSVPKCETGVPLITARNVRDGSLDFTVAEFVDEACYEAWMNRGLPQAGDVIFTTEAPLGNVAHFPVGGRFALGQRVVALRPDKSKMDPRFLIHFLLSPVGKRRIKLFATGSTAQGISSEQLKKLLIDFPSLTEQQRIAAVLDDWDGAISSTTKIIAAKQKLLAHQQLRLLSSPNWKWRPIAELFNEVRRKSNGTNPLVATISAGRGFLPQQERFNRILAGQSLSNYTILRKGEFAYNKGSSKSYEFGCAYLLSEPDEVAVPNVYVCFAP